MAEGAARTLRGGGACARRRAGWGHPWQPRVFRRGCGQRRVNGPCGATGGLGCADHGDEHPSRGRQSHAWYRAPADTVGNRRWQLSGAAGDIRGTNGYVVLWDAPQLADGLARGFDAAQPADPTQLPRPTSTRQGGPAAVRHAPVGARNETLNHEVFQDAMRGVVDPAAYRDAGHAAGLPGDEVERTLASAIQAGVGAAKPSLPKTRDGLKAALAGLGIAYRYNLRAERPELREGAGDWGPMNDRVEADVRARIAEHFTILRAAAGPAGPLSFGRVAWPDAFNALLYHAEVDPFVAWLDALPAWDGVARVSHWLARLFAADSNDPLVVWASRFLFLGAVWRAYQPGRSWTRCPYSSARKESGNPRRSVWPCRRSTRSGLPTACTWPPLPRCAPKPSKDA